VPEVPYRIDDDAPRRGWWWWYSEMPESGKGGLEVVLFVLRVADNFVRIAEPPASQYEMHPIAPPLLFPPSTFPYERELARTNRYWLTLDPQEAKTCLCGEDRFIGKRAKPHETYTGSS
jgi:hypothetical protein